MLTVHIKKQLSHFTLNVQFTVKEEIAVLFGPSGSGKTTILNCIAGLTKMNDGCIKLYDRLLNQNGKILIPVQERKIGYLFQDYALFPHKTVWENIAYGMKDETDTKNLIERLKISHLLSRFPHEISGGEKQRVAFIRALAIKPRLLLLDEPFSALDDKTKQLSYEELLTVQRDKNIPTLLVTHSQSDIESIADRVLVIHNGQLIETYRVER